MGQQLKGSEKISLRGLGIVKGDGRQRRAFTQKYLWTSVLICSQHPILTTLIALWNRDDNFFPLCLTRPSPLRPAWIFPPCKGNGAGMGARFQPRTTGRGGDGFRLFRPIPTSPRPSPSLPCPALLRVIIVNFLYPKTLLFKQTY